MAHLRKEFNQAVRLSSRVMRIGNILFLLENFEPFLASFMLSRVPIIIVEIGQIKNKSSILVSLPGQHKLSNLMLNLMLLT